MKIFVNHDFKYEAGHLIKAFGLKADFQDQADSADIVNTHRVLEDRVLITCQGPIVVEEVLWTQGVDPYEVKRQIKHLNGKVLYKVLSHMSQKDLPWGTLVGVRPAKIVHSLLEAGQSIDQIKVYLADHFMISQEKIDLISQVALAELPFLEDVYDHPISLYISVPFCPSQCLYCSFPSNDLKLKGHLVGDYLKVLKREIQAAYEGVRDHKLLVDCLYIGGGTPTALTADQFEDILSLLDQYFDLKGLKEFTIEAGRPKTITADKLKVFKKYHVSRVCLNPQTMHEKTLSHIGRYHSVEDIIKTYDLVKSFDFDCVNMDLILGLPGETIEDVKATIQAVVDMGPENITVHTLAVKRSSTLNQKREDYALPEGEVIKEMVDLVGDLLKEKAYLPYYLYRQKNMAGNFENVGYALRGYESCYNVRIIEEQHSILALGPGAISKKCDPKRSYFDRIATIKGLEQYIDRQDEVVDRVRAFFDPIEIQ